MNRDVVQVKVVCTEGCANTPPTIQRIREVAAELGIPIELTQVLVSTEEKAQEHRFLGSPTVLVNGLDLDPTMRSQTAFGFT
ncbi:MAG: thioredoxin family protein [Anaerolineae bacterium]|nr:thioredoxin family protein [Anaerolineae bacterium]